MNLRKRSDGAISVPTSKKRRKLCSLDEICTSLVVMAQEEFKRNKKTPRNRSELFSYGCRLMALGNLPPNDLANTSLMDLMHKIRINKPVIDFEARTEHVYLRLPQKNRMSTQIEVEIDENHYRADDDFRGSFFWLRLGGKTILRSETVHFRTIWCNHIKWSNLAKSCFGDRHVGGESSLLRLICAFVHSRKNLLQHCSNPEQTHFSFFAEYWVELRKLVSKSLEDLLFPELVEIIGTYAIAFPTKKPGLLQFHRSSENNPHDHIIYNHEEPAIGWTFKVDWNPDAKINDRTEVLESVKEVVKRFEFDLMDDGCDWQNTEIKCFYDFEGPAINVDKIDKAIKPIMNQNTKHADSGESGGGFASVDKWSTSTWSPDSDTVSDDDDSDTVSEDDE